MTNIVSSDTPAVPGARAYVDWGAILGGAFVAAALSTVMTSFGAAIGLSLTSPVPGKGVSMTTMAITTGLWVLWIAVFSFAAGGYLTGRLRRRTFDGTEHESNIRDGAHGAVVWALGTLLVAFLATSTLGSIAGTAAKAVGNATGGVLTEVAKAGADPLASAADRLMQPAAQQQGNTQAQAGDNTAAVTRVLARSAASGSVSPEDKAYLASQISARTGISQQDAEKRIDDTEAKLKQTVAEARQAAETARKYGILIAFLTAASLLISGAAAWGAAVIGGNHRDQGSEFLFLTRW